MVKRKSFKGEPGNEGSFVRKVSNMSNSGMMRAIGPKSYLENGFPVSKLHAIAAAQGNSKMPIYLIHKWWARRLGSVFRALLISSSIDAYSKDFWKKYYNGFLLKDKIIFDPFMGGGTTLIEGLRLGCKVVGCDINPVAWFVTKKEIDHFNIREADKCFEQLNKTVGREIRNLYRTRCPKGHKAEVLCCLWIRTISCRQCGKKHDLFNDLVVREKGPKQTVVCPECSSIFSSKIRANVRCSNGHNFEKNNVAVKTGIFTCPECKSKEKLIDAIKRKGGPFHARMFCVEYLCSKCGKRGYKKPGESDLKIFLNARRRMKRLANDMEFPRQKIHLNSKSDKRPISHGFTHYSDLFNERQLLSLGLLLKEIKKIRDGNMREFFLLTLSSCLETNNVLCKYETKWGKLSALFGIPAYHVPERYAENNLWGIGRGTFVRNYYKLRRGKKYGITPYEREYGGRGTDGRLDWKKKKVGLGITTEITSGNLFRRSEWNAIVECSDSRRVGFLPSKSVDAVVTDPPYFETIRYSELADFFYVWLRLGLRNQYDFFKPQSSQRRREAVARSTAEGDRDIFIRKLTQIFAEAHRVLKDDGPLVFTFHHTQAWAWEGLRKALHDSGFHVTATPIIRSEGRTGYRKGNSIGYDMCIVCRKTIEEKIPHSITSSSQNEHFNHIRKLKGLGKTMTDSEIFTVIMGDYLKVNDEGAEEIMNSAPLLVKEISEKLR